MVRDICRPIGNVAVVFATGATFDPDREIVRSDEHPSRGGARSGWIAICAYVDAWTSGDRALVLGAHRRPVRDRRPPQRVAPARPYVARARTISSHLGADCSRHRCPGAVLPRASALAATTERGARRSLRNH